MKARVIGQKMDPVVLRNLIFSSQFPILNQQWFDLITSFIEDREMVTKTDTGVYEMGFGKKQIAFLYSMMQCFPLGEFHEMKPHQVFIQRTGLGSANGTSKVYEIPPESHLRFILNFRETEGKHQVALKSKIGPGGVVYTTQSYATVLQRNLSAIEISSGKDLMDTRRETCNSYFVVVDMWCPTMVIMKVVNNTAGVRPIDFDKVINKPGAKKIIEGVVGSMDRGEMDMSTGMEMIKKIVAQQAGSSTESNVARLDDM